MATVRVDLGYVPRPWQQACHEHRKRFTVLALHRRAGKTELAIMELLDKALSFSKDLGLFFYVAPQLKQAKAIAWSRLKQKVDPLVRTGGAEVREGELSVAFPNGATIRIYGADNPDAMRGVRLDGVVLDEVAQMKPEVWQEIIQPALADRMGWALFIGTPNGINLFSELYYRGVELMSGGSATWHAARYTCFDTDALPAAEIQRMQDPAEMPEHAFAREMLCDFSASGENQLISLHDAETAAKRVLVAHEFNFSPKVLGVDVARFGDDRSVLMRRQGLKAFKPTVVKGLDNMALAGLVAEKIAQWKPDAVFVDAGGGAGVIDRLRQLGHSVYEVHFGGKASKPHLFINQRTAMWWEMAEWLRLGGAIPDMLALKQELATPTYSFDNAGRRVLESKDKIKERLQNAGSPDIADALALTFAFPVQHREPEWAREERIVEHNPYAGYRD